MSDTSETSDGMPQRLCSEIQLFDLCDLDGCHHKSGRFCTDSGLIGRFEKIAEKELRVQERFDSGECDNDDADDVDVTGYEDEDDMGCCEDSEEDGCELKE